MPHIGYFPVPAFPRPLSISPAQFIPQYDTYDWCVNDYQCMNSAALTEQRFYAPVNLPQGAVVQRLTLWAQKADAGDHIALNLRRYDRSMSVDNMATITATGSPGYSSWYTDVIDHEVIDNENYSYGLECIVDPDGGTASVRLTGAVIKWK